MELDHLLVSNKARKGGIEEGTEWQRWEWRKEEMKKKYQRQFIYHWITWNFV